jgi:hypothetical protein
MGPLIIGRGLSSKQPRLWTPLDNVYLLIVLILCLLNISGNGCGKMLLITAAITAKGSFGARVSAFGQTINAFPLVLAERLWVKSHLKSEEEKLRVST